ncbi:unnamed protein product (macronuclear) [Paramecium tetraurelia]|uniref:AMP-dependent synthetase/ligase domain-containing protein n=1 Tax=Paramecium tetraurelia TaxID=5888 RepID=A0BE27_PARTE|nr:uncharacterized protein GSPATT00027826001 [Paramecium tetraurelia]CAK56794.1 unnamed protein product [Paramecium tetraurelia]|eukprot:XP_001424192.1 hypothetical protein (macronuclear) [Paramecium tetraurelia strain d4-2]
MLRSIQQGFSNLAKANPLKNGFRFENQNLTWTFGEFDTHSSAFAYGLIEQGWKQGDKLLFLLGRSNTSEAAAAFVGAAKAGVTVIPFRSNDQNEIENTIGVVNPKGIVFSPNQLIGETKFIEVLNNLVPETSQTQSGQILKSSKFSNLKWLIHTGFYSYPGTYKFRESLVYASRNFNRLSLPSSTGPITAVIKNGQLQSYSYQDLVKLSEKVSGSQHVIISGDPQTVTNFSIVVGGLERGYNTVFTGGDNLNKVQKILQYYGNYSLVVDDSVLGEHQKLDVNNLQNLFTTGDVNKAQNIFQKQAVQL